MRDATETLQVGTILGGKYRIDSVIGKGGMGVVYEATYLALARKVAIKTLHPEYQRNPVVLERFRQEARAAGAIKHDNICEVTDIGTMENDVPFLVMPLLEGVSLSELMQQTRMSLVEILDVVNQTLFALQAVHNAGIVHRDLKPDNIFLIQMGDRHNFVKLLDFGVSKFPAEDRDGGLTRTRETIGTPYYMSPEQIAKAKTVDSRTDIYAVGVILYEILTGRRPFVGEGYNEIIVNISIGSFPLPSRLNPDIDPALEALVLKAMAQDPNDRFATANDMRDQINTLIRTLGDAQLLSPLSSPVGSNSGAASTSDATAADRGSLPLSDDPPFPAIPSDRAPSPTSRKRRVWQLSLIAVLVGAVVTATSLLMSRNTGREPTPDSTVKTTNGTTFSQSDDVTFRPTSIEVDADTSAHTKPTTAFADERLQHTSPPKKEEPQNRPAKQPRTRNADFRSDEKGARSKAKRDTDDPNEETITGKEGTLFFKDY